MRFHIGWGGERNIFYKGVETFPFQTRFKNREGKLGRKNPKRTISTSGGLRPLQIVSEPDTGRCASEEVEPQRGVDTRLCVSKDIGPRRGWIVRSTYVGEGNETFFIGLSLVWESPSRNVNTRK